MIYGTGTDIVEIKRIEKALNKESFVKKCFTENEIIYLKSKNFSPETAAGIFAAKEAISKALGTGFRGFMPQDLEILHNEFFKPYVNLLPKGEKIADNLGVNNIYISISHCRDYALAFALAEKDV